mmetsp:Transcript_20827/g.66274  ORF Transcript_20827/g.66274 Transcript_20827/m.66274 type:complete len:487 (-) Transcript_20827:82-1542(-)
MQGRAAVLGEEGDRRLRLGNAVRAQQVARRLGVEVPVGEVHLARLLHPPSSGGGVARVLVHARLDEVEVEAGRRVVDGDVELRQRRRRVAAAVVVLRQQHARPHQRRRGLLFGSVRESARRLQRGHPPRHDLAEERARPRALGAERLEVREQRRHALAHVAARVRVQGGGEGGRRAREIERQPHARLALRVGLLQLAVQRGQRRLRLRRHLRAQPPFGRGRRLQLGRLEPRVPPEMLWVARQQCEVFLSRLAMPPDGEQQRGAPLTPAGAVGDLPFDGVEVIERLAWLPRLLDERIFVQQHLAVLIRLLGGLVRPLDRPLVRLHHAHRLVVPPDQVQRHRKGEPVHPVGRLHREQLLARLEEARQQPELDLKHRQVAQDLDVFRLVTQRAAVALDGLRVLAVGAVEKAVDVPADLRLDVELDALADEFVRLLLLLHAVQQQPLHRDRLAVLRELFEHLVGGTQPLLVALELVVLDDGLEERGLLGR